MARLRVFIDTNAIVEAHRTGCWKAIVGSHCIETVEQIVIECATGDKLRRDYVPVDIEALRARIEVRKVKKQELIDLELKLAGAVVLDEGEKHLIAYAINQKGEWWICSPDNYSVRAAIKLGIKDKLISLEKIAVESGVRPSLKSQYGKKWLRKKITQLLFEEF